MHPDPRAYATVLDAFHLAADSAKVVPVPKDVDALLALSFGQVDAALVTSEQYELLARTNPSEAERLRVLAFSPEVGLPPVFASSDADPVLRDRLQDLLVRLPQVSGGASVLAMLGFDSFVAEAPVSPDKASALPPETPSDRQAVALPLAESAPVTKKTEATAPPVASRKKTAQPNAVVPGARAVHR